MHATVSVIARFVTAVCGVLQEDADDTVPTI